MYKFIYSLTDFSNKAVVEAIRKRFLLEIDTNPYLYDPIDVERCRSEDWQIEKFLLEKGTPDEAYKALVKAMKWKKSFGVHQRDQRYPKEFYEILNFERYSVNKQGQTCVWIVLRNYRKVSEFKELFQQFSAYLFESLDRLVGNASFITMVDAQVSFYLHYQDIDWLNL